MDRSSKLPALRQFGDFASFTELLPPSRALPAAPRFIYGAMPPAVATEFFQRQFLPQIGLYKARDITVGAGPGLYHRSDMLVAPELNLQAEHIEEAMAYHGLTGMPEPGRKVDGPHALIAGPGYHIYGHWLAEILPKLGLLQGGGLDLDTLRLLLPHDTPRFALEMLRLLGFQDTQLVRFGGPFGSVTVSELVATSFLHNAVRYVGSLERTILILRDRVERRFGRLAQGNYPKRLCVARRGGNRPSASRAMIEAECADAGFRVVAPETLPLLEQWRMFADAHEVIGEYGSALHGVIFSQPGTIVCGIRGSGFHPAFIQSGMGERLLQPTGYVFGVNEADDAGAFRVEQEDLRACLMQVFSGVSVPLGIEPRTTPDAPVDSVDGFLTAHDAYLDAGQLDQAHRSLRNAQRRDASAPGIYARLARLLDRMGGTGALVAITRAIDQGEATAPNYVLQASLLLRDDKIVDALKAAEAAMRLEPNGAEIWHMLAEANLRNGRTEAAISAARRARELEPHETRHGLILFEALTANSESDDTRTLIEELYRNGPRNLGVACAYARLLLQQGAAAQALTIALAGLAQDGIDPALRLLVAGLLAPLAVSKASAPLDGSALAANFVVSKAFTIDFAVTGNSAVHSVSGWSGQEPQFVWAIGETSVLLLPALDPVTDWTIDMHVSPLNLPPTVSAQWLTVRTESTVLFTERLAEPVAVRVFLPKELLASRQPLPLVLEHPDYATPRDLGVSKDTRPLAVCFRLIRVAPADIRSGDNPASRNPIPAA